MFAAYQWMFIMMKTRADGDVAFDNGQVHHALEAVESLLAAGMVSHARTVVADAKAIVEPRLPQHADVIELRSRRDR